jgi:hypothetical protein
MTNDADIEMAQMEEAAAQAHAGVCSICDEALNPLDPKWAGSYTNPRYTAAIAAELAGPVHPSLPWHLWCAEEVGA